MSEDNNICLICANTTEKRGNAFFDLCETCKLEKNCFNCRFSKCWYLRNKGRCDLNFNVFIPLSIILDKSKDQSNESLEKLKEEMIKYLKQFEVDFENVKHKNIGEICEILETIFMNDLKNKLSDCHLYKTKKIGNTIADFWNHKTCKRFNRGNATKEEWDDYHADLAYDQWVEEQDYPDYSEDYYEY